MGTATVIDPELQLLAVAFVPLKATVLAPWGEPKPVPVIVTGTPIAPELSDRLKIFGATVNGIALLATASTLTTTDPLPAVAALGTDTMIDVLLQFVGDPAVPLNVTELVPCEVPNPLPLIVTTVPAMPELVDKFVMFGSTANCTPLLGPASTVTTTRPVVAAAGTVTTIDLDPQLVGVAATPLKVTVLLPCDPSKPVPVIVTEVPTIPDVVERPVIVGRAVPVPEMSRSAGCCSHCQ